MKESLVKITASPSSSDFLLSCLHFPSWDQPRGAQPAAGWRCCGRELGGHRGGRTTWGDPNCSPWCLPAQGSACWWCWAPAEAAPVPSPRWSLSQCMGFLSLRPHNARPYLLLLTPCEGAAAAKWRQQIRNAKNFQRSLPILLFGKVLSITLCTENKHERKNSPLPSVVRAKTRIPWALFRSANILP